MICELHVDAIGQTSLGAGRPRVVLHAIGLKPFVFQKAGSENCFKLFDRVWPEGQMGPHCALRSYW